MINEIKIDHTKPVWVNAWDNGAKEKCKRPYLYTLGSYHHCIHSSYIKEFLDGKDYQITRFDNIEFIKEKKRIQLDAKTCPRRPVLTYERWGEGSEYYPDIHKEGLDCNSRFFTWTELFEDHEFKINGMPASREVDG